MRQALAIVVQEPAVRIENLTLERKEIDIAQLTINLKLSVLGWLIESATLSADLATAHPVRLRLVVLAGSGRQPQHTNIPRSSVRSIHPDAT